MSFFYDEAGVCGLLYNGATCYHYVKNLQGDIVALLDSRGTVVAKYLYDPWGVPTVTNEAGAVITDTSHIGHLNPFRYRGYYYDVETGLYYLQSRYYDPEIGRFVTIDDIAYLAPDTVNGLNLYAYCGNNPVMAVDPSGHIWNILIGTIVGTAIGFVTSVVTQLLDDDAPSLDTWQFWAHVAVSTLSGAVSGGLAASGVGLVGQIGWNAAFGAISSVFDNIIDGCTDVWEYLSDGGISALLGALGGLFGGEGSASKHTQNSFRRLFDNWNFRYYFSQIKTQAVRDGFKAIRGIIKSNIPSWLKSLYEELEENP